MLRIRRHIQLWFTIRISLLCLVATATLPGHVFAILTFVLPEIEILGDSDNPVMGAIDVLLSVEGEQPDVLAFSVEFTAKGTGFTLGMPELPLPDMMPLFTGPEANFIDKSQFDGPTSTHTIRAGLDSSTVKAFDNAKIITVPFTIDAGFLGTIPLEFVEGVEVQLLATPEGMALPLELRSGSINVVNSISPVPEVNAALMCTVAAVCCGCGAIFRRRRHERP